MVEAENPDINEVSLADSVLQSLYINGIIFLATFAAFLILRCVCSFSLLAPHERTRLRHCANEHTPIIIFYALDTVKCSNLGFTNQSAILLTQYFHLAATTG